MSIIDHLGIYCPAAQYDDLVNFYAATLEPLGIVKIQDENGLAMFGKAAKGEPEFEIFKDDRNDSLHSDRPRLHYAFVADTRQAVREFHAAGLRIGAKSNGEPGLRKDYTPTYYASFLTDSIGNTIEVVCQDPKEAGK